MPEDSNHHYSMKKKFTVLLVCAAFLLLISVLMTQLYKRISADNFLLVKNVIKSKLDNRGYELLYESIEINPSLVPSISLQKVVFKNKESLEQEILFEADELVINFEILPLLIKKDFVVDDLDVNHAKVFVTRDKDGANNWFRSSQKNTSSSRTHVSLDKSNFKDVELYYSGPTFSNKKILFNEAVIAYSLAGALVIEKAEGAFNNYNFLLSGVVDSVDSFINGKGANIDVDFDVDRILSLQLMGEIGTISLPTEKGIKIVAKGENIAVFIKKIFPDFSVPEIDSFILKGNLYSNGDSELKLDIDDALAIDQSNTVKISGSIIKREQLFLDLQVLALGNNLYQLEQGFSLPENIKKYIPFTDKYQLETHLKGSIKSIEANLIKAQFDLDDHHVEFNGRIQNMNKLKGLALNVELNGDNLFELKENALSTLDLPFIVPITDEYHLNFHLAGGLEEWKFSAVKAELTSDENSVLVLNNSSPFFTLNELHIKVKTAGKDLFHFVSLLGLHELVGDSIGATGVQHDLSFSLDGALSALKVSELDAKLLYKDNDIKLQGEVADLNNLNNMDLDFDITGNENDLAVLLGESHYEDIFLHAAGRFEGNLKEFTLHDFFYQGDRGYSSGTMQVDMNGKPEFKARLGDTKLFFKSEENSASTNAQRNSEAEVINLAWMDNLDVDVSYESLFVIRNKAELEILGGKILMKNGMLKWNPLQMNYKGRVIESNLFIDALKDQLHFSANANQIDLGALLKDLDWFTRFVGLADFDFDFKSEGASDKELIANLKGNGKIIFRNGKVTDFGSASMSYVQALTPWRKSIADLEMQCFLTSITAEKGVLDFKHLFMENKEMYLTGGGKINLNTYTMDLAVAPRVKNKNFLDANVSLFVKGPLNDPKVQVGKLSAVSDVGLKYGQWALLGPLSLALPKLKFGQTPSCEHAIENL